MKIDIYDKHISVRRKPVNLKEEEIGIFAHEFRKEIRECHLLQLSTILILGDTLFSLRKAKFYESYTRVKKRKKYQYLRNLIYLFTKPKLYEKAVWIIDDWSVNYFHWITDALSRLVASQQFLTGQHILLLPAKFKSIPFVGESLVFFDVPVVYYSPSRQVRIGDLILPSHTSETGNYNHEILMKLRDRFSLDDPNPHRKIYISRKKAARRHIINESEVETTMITSGFEIHYFEDYDFKMQMKIMYEAKVVIALHGAGLTNILFMRKATRVLELRNATDAHNNCYFSLASELGIDYYHQMNQGDSERTTIANMTVDIDELKKNIILLLS